MPAKRQFLVFVDCGIGELNSILANEYGFIAFILSLCRDFDLGREGPCGKRGIVRAHDLDDAFIWSVSSTGFRQRDSAYAENQRECEEQGNDS